MNPLTQIKNTQKATKREIELGLAESASWHAEFKHSAYVFIGGLDYELTEGDVLAVFSQYGEIADLNLVRDKSTGKPRGFAFIAYEDQRSTNLAVDNLSGAKVAGRTIRVEHVGNYKKKKAEMEGEPVPEDEPEQRVAPAGGRQAAAAAATEINPGHGASSRGLAAPWAAPSSYIALMEEARELQQQRQQAGATKEHTHKKHKKAKEKKEKKAKKEKRHRSQDVSSSDDEAAHHAVKRTQHPASGRAEPTEPSERPSFGPPKPPMHRGNTVGPPGPSSSREPDSFGASGRGRAGQDGHRGGHHELDAGGDRHHGDTSLRGRDGKTGFGRDQEADYGSGRDGAAHSSGRDREADRSGRDREADRSGRDREADRSRRDREADRSGRDIETDRSGRDREADRSGRDREADRSGRNQDDRDRSYDRDGQQRSGRESVIPGHRRDERDASGRERQDIDWDERGRQGREAKERR